MAVRHNKRYARRKAAGLCAKCPNPSPDGPRCGSCQAKANEVQARYYRRLRMKALEAYGLFCACCGTTELRFLTIDHIHNDGAAHRREVGKSGPDFLQWLKKNNYPPGFQVLCAKCNSAKYWEGECPHQSEKRKPEKLFEAFGLLSAV